MPRQPLVLLTLVALALALALCAAPTVLGSSTTVQRVARGSLLRIKLTTSSYADCVLVVNYADGGLQTGGIQQAVDGRLAWTLRVARSRPLGRGTWYVRCGLATQRTGVFVVVNPPAAG